MITRFPPIHAGDRDTGDEIKIQIELSGVIVATTKEPGSHEDGGHEEGGEQDEKV